MKENLKDALIRAIGERNEDFKRAQISREEVEKLGNIYIKQQHQIHQIADFLMSYPSLVRKLAEWTDVKEIALAPAQNQIKPELRKEGLCAYICCRM